MGTGPPWSEFRRESRMKRRFPRKIRRRCLSDFGIKEEVLHREMIDIFDLNCIAVAKPDGQLPKALMEVPGHIEPLKIGNIGEVGQVDYV